MGDKHSESNTASIKQDVKAMRLILCYVVWNQLVIHTIILNNVIQTRLVARF